MIRYGIELNSDYDIEKQNAYNMFVNYYGNILLEKHKNDDNFSHYMAKVDCMLSNEYRYIVIIVPLDNYSIGTKIELNQLKWISLQTRTLKGYYPVYNTTVKENKEMCNNSIVLKTREDDITTYNVMDIDNIEVILINNNNKFQYSEKGTLKNALNTYQTIIRFK
jgi:hypothetical protein